MPIKGDFISFSYNGVHSTDLGVMRVTSSNRYTDALLPTIQDKTVQASGSDGTYFFGSYYTQRPITINVAFDEVSESQIRLMRKTFGDGLSHELIFDDEPYKVYYAKATGIPQLQYIPFSTPRVYKGEGTFTFICYDPFAHCKNSQKYLSEFPDATTNVGMNGNIIGFNNGVGNFKKVEVEIEPIQDLHGYSSPWPAGGGKNKLPSAIATIKALNTTGTWSGNDYTINGITYKLEGNAEGVITKIVVNGTASGNAMLALAKNLSVTSGQLLNGAPSGGRLFVSNSTGQTDYARDMGSGATISTTDTTAYCYIQTLNGSTPSNLTYYPMIRNSGDSATFAPYSNICPISGRTGLSVYVGPTQDQQDATTYAVDWTSQAGTVYGGTLDVVTGVLTVDWAYKEFNGTEGWFVGSNYMGLNNAVDYASKDNNDTTQISNVFVGAGNHYSFYNSFRVQTNKAVVVGNKKEDETVGRWSDADAFRSFLAGLYSAGTPFAVCYPLATPLTYQLTPQEISTLSGQNYIWSNLETNIDIVYKRLTGITELFKLEWNPSAQLLESKGIYDSYNSSTGFKLYNPGDLETNFKLKVPISASIGGIKIDDGNNHDLESHILMLNGNTITPKGNDAYLLFNSRTNLIEGLNADGARTMNLYNEYISSGHWFKIPMNESNKTWYFVPINYSGDTPVLEYDYLYF